MYVTLQTKVQEGDACTCHGEEISSLQHRRRHFHATMMQTEDEPTPPFSIANIKHSMLDMYSATKTATTGRLRKILDKSRSPFVHLNVDK